MFKILLNEDHLLMDENNTPLEFANQVIAEAYMRTMNGEIYSIYRIIPA